MRILACVAAAALLVGGCQKQQAQQTEAAPIVDEIGGPVAAVVNGEKIYVSEVQLEAESQGIASPGEPLEGDSGEFARVLDQLIDLRLLARQAEQRRLHEDPQAAHRLNTMRERILGELLIDAVVAANVDEAAIRKMYEAQLAIYQLGEEAHLRQIVAATKDDILAISAQLANGADFVVLAAEKSIDEETRLDGGDLGYMTEHRAPAALARVIRTTPVGGVSKPFQTEQGWHVVKVEDRRKESPPTLEELRPPIIEHLKRLQIEDTLRELRKTAKVQKLAAASTNAIDVDPFELAPVEPDAASEAAPAPAAPDSIAGKAPGETPQ